MSFSGEQGQILLNVARAAIRGTLCGQTPDPPDGEVHPSLRQPAGCFVSLHEVFTHRLRGCVGRLDGRDPVLTAVYHSAIAVLSDPRFSADPVTREELARLELELTVLSPLSPADHPLHFDPLVHGIYLALAGRSGCFLPQVARETGWTREQLLSRLCTEKLCCSAEAWKHPAARLFTFTAEIIGPEGFEGP